MRRAWTRFRSLDDWAQASVTCATIATLWFLISRTPSLISGEPDALGKYLAGVALIYFWCLMASGAGYHQRHAHDRNYPEHSSPPVRLAPKTLRRMTMVAIAFEVVALSVDALLTAATKLARGLLRGAG